MIRAIGQNDVLEAILLMKKSTEQHAYKDIEYNEGAWISYFCSLVEKQANKDPNALVIGYYNMLFKHQLQGFLSAATYINYYNNKPVMDVKDCIVDYQNKRTNPKITSALFDHMIEHTKKHGGKYWRADSVQQEDNALRYAKFLEKRYKGNIQISVRGCIE